MLHTRLEYTRSGQKPQHKKPYLLKAYVSQFTDTCYKKSSDKQTNAYDVIKVMN